MLDIIGCVSGVMVISDLFYQLWADDIIGCVSGVMVISVLPALG